MSTPGCAKLDMLHKRICFTSLLKCLSLLPRPKQIFSAGQREMMYFHYLENLIYPSSNPTFQEIRQFYRFPVLSLNSTVENASKTPVLLALGSGIIMLKVVY